MDCFNNESPRSAPRKGRGVALLLTCSLVGGASGLGGAALWSQLNPADSAPNVIYQNSAPTTQVGYDTYALHSPADLYNQNVDSCVIINVSSTTDIVGHKMSSSSTGSGFVLTDDGYIVTNYHLFSDLSADTTPNITVTLHDGRNYSAYLTGFEVEHDIAVLYVDAEELSPVRLGSSDDLNIGDPVLAIGNPLGELTNSLTDGMISGLDRVITTESNTTMRVLQTNCAINPGNSGGALFNARGEVVGITSGKYAISNGIPLDGIGFAIPIDDITDILHDIMEFGEAKNRAYLGIRALSVSLDEQLAGEPAGARVVNAAAGSCAETAGLLTDDIIVAIDNTEIASSEQLVVTIRDYQAGRKIQLSIVRDGTFMTLSVTLDEKNDVTEAANTYTDEN